MGGPKLVEWKEHTPIHLMPTWRSGYKHQATPDCFCRPRRRSSPGGFSIYVHHWRFKHVACVYEGQPVPVRYAPVRKRSLRLAKKR